MMHRNDFVVSIRPADCGKSYREYKIDDSPDLNYCRYRKVCIPFDQEYELVFKNMKNVRRSINIEIDGTPIGNWIIGNGSKNHPNKVTLERFMDSDKRFKVLRLSDDQIDDPFHLQNGEISITVYDEKDIDKIIRNSYRGVNYSCDSIPTSNMTSNYGVKSCSTNAATGEGSKSNQRFITSVWNGNSGIPLLFVFKINGVERPTHNTTPKSGPYCHQCGTKIITNKAKYCHQCGTKVLVNA